MPLSKFSLNNPFRAGMRRHDRQESDGVYAPPPGPPPAHLDIGQESVSGKGPGSHEYEPPAGPPPPPSSNSTDETPPPYHDWQSIPDTALLPPPPMLGNFLSPSSNAEGVDAEQAKKWCQQHPLIQPHKPSYRDVVDVQMGDIALWQPPMHPSSMRPRGRGIWSIETTKDSADSCFLSTLPLFFVLEDSPLRTQRSKTIYFEIKIKSLKPRTDGNPSSIALGFCAVPYPPFRMPGWERGSLAVHSDDGHRYINDNQGGKDFTAPILPGDTAGIGISFSIPDATNVRNAGDSLKGEVFFTRNGHQEGMWNIHEELDGDNTLGVLGVDGKYDLFAAIGIYGRASLDVIFCNDQWQWKPKR